MSIKTFVLENSKNKKVRRDSVQKAVREYLGSAKIKVTYDDNGKATIEGTPDPKYISITCCGDIMLVILADVRVGIDGEYMPRILAEDNKIDYITLSERFFTEDENDFVRDGDNVAENFAKVWIRKEAYVKCIGKTVSEFPNFSVVENGKLLNRVSGVAIKRFAIKIPDIENYLFFIAGID